MLCIFHDDSNALHAWLSLKDERGEVFELFTILMGATNCWTPLSYALALKVPHLCCLQYILGALGALLVIYAATALLSKPVKRVLLLDFECFTPPQR